MNKESLFSTKVQEMKAYHVQNSTGLIKLDSMELPLSLPDEMTKALATTLSLVPLNRYPKTRFNLLLKKTYDVFSIPKELSILYGNGSDELIQIILMAVLRPNTNILGIDPSFVMYRQTAEILGMNYYSQDLNENFEIDEDSFLNKIEQYNPSVIFFAYPNNPTGTTLDRQFIQKVIEKTNGFVVLDEAYTAFADDSLLDFTSQYKNVILIRTLSKIGLAGIRLGYMVCQNDIAAQFDKVRMPYNINVLTHATAKFMLANYNYLEKEIDIIKKEKSILYQYLLDHEHITTYPSQANFLLAKVKNSTEIFTSLRESYGILIKNMDGYHPTLKNTLRITVGNPRENKMLIDALNKLL